MKHVIAVVFLAVYLSACERKAESPAKAPAPEELLEKAAEPQANAPSFSFDEVAAPSLMDINQGEFRKALEGRRYALTNVDASFDRLFTLIFDEARSVHIIEDKQGQILFEGFLDVPRYAASLDVDADGTPDVLLNLASYGNHGNGRESFELLLNVSGRLVQQENPIGISFFGGQEDRAGKLTWYSDPAVSAVFDGEDAKVLESGDGSIQVGALAKIHEVWGHKDGTMRLLSKSSTPIQMQDAHHLTFR